jgi:hypothetical protein
MVCYSIFEKRKNLRNEQNRESGDSDRDIVAIEDIFSNFIEGHLYVSNVRVQHLATKHTYVSLVKRTERKKTNYDALQFISSFFPEMSTKKIHFLPLLLTNFFIFLCFSFSPI